MPGSDKHRPLKPLERIEENDEFQYGGLEELGWAPCHEFVGFRVEKFTRVANVKFRRPITMKVESAEAPELVPARS